MPINFTSTLAGASGGTVAITSDTQSVDAAPKSYRFGVDLSGATFDTTGPSGTEVYDARLHDLIFLWDTGDTGTWSAPTKVVPEWNDKSRARGPWFSHCYKEPGTYTVGLTVIEPSSGKTATDSVEITVGSADTAYPTTQTVCINSNGYAGANTWGPAGATYVEWDNLIDNANGQTWWASVNLAQNTRFLFDPAQDYSGGEFGFLLDSTVNITHPFFGSATSTRAGLPCSAGTTSDEKFIKVENTYTANQDIRLAHLEITSTYDPTTEFYTDVSASGKGESVIRTNMSCDLVAHDVRSSGLKNVTWGLYANGSGGNGFFHLDDVRVDGLGGQYGGLFLGAETDLLPDSSLTLSGVALVQNPNAIDGGNVLRAAMRENGCHNSNYRCVEIFSLDDGNSGAKLCTTPNVEIGHLINVDGMRVEGGLDPFDIQQNVTQGIGRTVAVNAIVDGLAVLCTYSSQCYVRSKASGVTLRNVLGITPSSPVLYNGAVSDPVGWHMDDEEGGGAVYSTRKFRWGADFAVSGLPGAETLAAPIKLHNLTFRNDRTFADNNANEPDAFSIDAQFTDTTTGNNILHGDWVENAGADTLDAPLTTTTLWAPDCLGFKGYVTKTIYTEFTTPADAMKDSKPDTGSAALGDATTGLVAYFDITGQVRGATTDRGAWNPSGYAS